MENPGKMRKGFGEKLAKALGTTHEILFQYWKDVAPNSVRILEPPVNLSHVRERDLMAEVSKRWSTSRSRLLEYLEMALNVDWNATYNVLKKKPHNLPPELLDIRDRILLGLSLAAEDLDRLIQIIKIYITKFNEYDELSLRAKEVLSNPSFERAFTILINPDLAKKGVQLLAEVAAPSVRPADKPTMFLSKADKKILALAAALHDAMMTGEFTPDELPESIRKRVSS